MLSEFEIHLLWVRCDQDEKAFARLVELETAKRCADFIDQWMAPIGIKEAELMKISLADAIRAAYPLAKP